MPLEGTIDTVRRELRDLALSAILFSQMGMQIGYTRAWKAFTNFIIDWTGKPLSAVKTPMPFGMVAMWKHGNESQSYRTLEQMATKAYNNRLWGLTKKNGRSKIVLLQSPDDLEKYLSGTIPVDNLTDAALPLVLKDLDQTELIAAKTYGILMNHWDSKTGAQRLTTLATARDYDSLLQCASYAGYGLILNCSKFCHRLKLLCRSLKTNNHSRDPDIIKVGESLKRIAIDIGKYARQFDEKFSRFSNDGKKKGCQTDNATTESNFPHHIYAVYNDLNTVCANTTYDTDVRNVAMRILKGIEHNAIEFIVHPERLPPSYHLLESNREFCMCVDFLYRSILGELKHDGNNVVDIETHNKHPIGPAKRIENLRIPGLEQFKAESFDRTKEIEVNYICTVINQLERLLDFIPLSRPSKRIIKHGNALKKLLTRYRPRYELDTISNEEFVSATKYLAKGLGLRVRECDSDFNEVYVDVLIEPSLNFSELMSYASCGILVRWLKDKPFYDTVTHQSSAIESMNKLRNEMSGKRIRHGLLIHCGDRDSEVDSECDDLPKSAGLHIKQLGPSDLEMIANRQIGPVWTDILSITHLGYERNDRIRLLELLVDFLYTSIKDKQGKSLDLVRSYQKTLKYFRDLSLEKIIISKIRTSTEERVGFHIENMKHIAIQGNKLSRWKIYRQLNRELDAIADCLKLKPILESSLQRITRFFFPSKSFVFGLFQITQYLIINTNPAEECAHLPTLRSRIKDGLAIPIILAIFLFLLVHISTWLIQSQYLLLVSALASICSIVSFFLTTSRKLKV